MVEVGSGSRLRLAGDGAGRALLDLGNAARSQGRTPDPAKLLPGRDRIKIRLRCKICGRPRAVYRKFGICRICLRNMASDGLIPGLKKASW